MKQPPPMLTAPWLITQAGHRLVMAIWSRGALFREELEQARADNPGPYGSEADGRGAPYVVEDEVAIIPVSGTLFRKASWFTQLSSAGTDEAIQAAVKQAVADRFARGIVVDFHSPGGEAMGSAETAGILREASKIKPVVGYSGGMACSKAFWYLTACTRAVATEDAQLGSLGARCGLMDDSKADEAMGYRYIELVSGISPDKRNWPVDQAVIDATQRELDAIAAVFADHVALGRGKPLEYVVAHFGRGGIVLGRSAVEVGMIDLVGNRDAAKELALSLSGSQQPAALVAASGRAGVRATRSTMPKTNPSANADNMECNDCNKQLGGADPIYCGSCAGKSQEASAAVKFRTDLFASLGVTTEAEALGKITSGVAAVQELPGVTAERDRLLAAGLKRDLRAVLTEGFASGRLTLGRATAQLPVALRGAAKAQWKAGCEAMAEQTQPAFLAAVEGVQLTEDDLVALRESIAAFSPVAATPQPEKPRDAKAESAALSLDEKRAKELDDAMGIKPDQSAATK